MGKKNYSQNKGVPMRKNCGDSLMTEQLSFLTEDGGLIPTSPLQCKIYECNFENIEHIFRKFHYKSNHMGGGISFCLKLDYLGHVIGGMVVGKPRHIGKYKNSLEIRRMACLDDAPKNTESYFLSKCIWFCKKAKLPIDYLLSYSDMSVGHIGTIYKAANFHCIGKTSKTKHVYWNGTRYHPRSLTIDRPYSYKLREAIENGEAQIVEELPKKIWIYKIKKE